MDGPCATPWLRLAGVRGNVQPGGCMITSSTDRIEKRLLLRAPRSLGQLLG